MMGTQSRNILLIFVMTAVALLVSTSPQMISAQPIEMGSTSGPNASSPNQEGIDHINQAQSALQNGDTEGAQMHMDLAKKALTPCNPGDPHC